MSVSSLLCGVERRTGWLVFSDCHSRSRFCQRPSPKGMEQTAADQELRVRVRGSGEKKLSSVECRAVALGNL